MLDKCDGKHNDCPDDKKKRRSHLIKCGDHHWFCGPHDVTTEKGRNDAGFKWFNLTRVWKWGDSEIGMRKKKKTTRETKEKKSKKTETMRKKE